MFCLVMTSVAGAAQSGSSSLSLTPVELSSPRVLTGNGKVSLGVPRFGSSGDAVCDSSNNFYFNLATGAKENGPFLGFLNGGTKHVLFLLPEAADSRGFTQWAVSPGGSFVVLHGDFKETNLYDFRSDGSLSRSITIDLPKNVNVTNFAMANSGVIYIRGYRYSGEPQEAQLPGFAALFGESGKLLRDLSLDTTKTDLKIAGIHPPEGAVSAGDDGRFYVLSPGKVVVLSQSGDTERTLKFEKPDRAALARHILTSRGRISIGFDIVHGNPRQGVEIEARELLIDSTTGAPLADYVFASDLGNVVLCFDARVGYTLYDVDEHLAAKQIVPLK